MAQGMLRDRRDVMNLLGAAMSRAYSELTEQQRLNFGSKLLKTYLLEIDGTTTRMAWTDVLATAGARIDATADKDLVTATIPIGRRPTTTRPDPTLIIDRASDRFLLCHSLNDSSDSDAAIDRLTAHRALDSLWLTSQFLEDTARLGALRGFSTRYERAPVSPAADDRETLFTLDPGGEDNSVPPIESLNLRLGGYGAQNALALLRQVPDLRRASSLSSIRIKYSAEPRSSAFSINELTFNGKTTAHGSSYAIHRQLLERILAQYQSALEFIESNHRIRTVGSHIVGNPVILTLDPPIEPNVIIQSVFAGTQPFRLVGVPSLIASDYWRVSAVDLHGGHRIDFEIAPDLIRIYLREEACGNSLLRFEANFQHHIQGDARIPGLRETAYAI